MYCSLWHLQRYSYLRKAAMERWSCDEASINNLDKYNIWNRMLDRREIEKFWTVAALLSDLGLSPSYGHYPFQHENKLLAQDAEGKESSRAAWTFSQATPPPFLSSFDLPPSQYLSDSNNNHHSPVWNPPPSPPITSATDAWHLTPQYRSWHPLHVSLFQQASTAVSIGRKPSSHSLVNLKPWRRLGMIIWDDWRMYSLGLYELPRMKALPTPNGGLLEAPQTNLRGLHISSIDYVSRWLALIGE